MPPRDSFTHTVLECSVGMSFENRFFTLDSLSEVVWSFQHDEINNFRRVDPPTCKALVRPKRGLRVFECTCMTEPSQQRLS